jgi:hypothetical protein
MWLELPQDSAVMDLGVSAVGPLNFTTGVSSITVTILVSTISV